MKPDTRLNQVRFWRRQARDIKEGGLSALLRKCLVALLGTPIILVLRFLRPLVLVRFGGLPSLAFGMFAQATEQYLCERDAGLQPKRTIDIFHLDYRVSNQQLKKMWGRTLHISPLARLLYSANSLLPGGEAHVVLFPNDEDRHGVIPRSKMHLFFTAEEEHLGLAGLRGLGLPDNAPFVCIYARDTGYKGQDTGHKWSSYLNQDENLHGYRNASIHNYLLAAEELARRGYFVLRMGAVVNEALQTSNPMIVDYATKARSDFMDIFLLAGCRFFLGGNGGLNTVSRIFRRPVVVDNFAPITVRTPAAFYPGNLLIPKKLWLRDEHRYMTFREFLKTCPEKSPAMKHFERIGVDVIENTSEELLDVAVEMDERLTGKWQMTEEDDELQQRFWSLVKMNQPNQKFWPRMGAQFLRQNRKLLD